MCQNCMPTMNVNTLCYIKVPAQDTPKSTFSQLDNGTQLQHLISVFINEAHNLPKKGSFRRVEYATTQNTMLYTLISESNQQNVDKVCFVGVQLVIRSILKNFLYRNLKITPQNSCTSTKQT